MIDLNAQKLRVFTATITDPADAPASADALREDLVSNTIPSIETILSDHNDILSRLVETVNRLDKENKALREKLKV